MLSESTKRMIMNEEKISFALHFANVKNTTYGGICAAALLYLHERKDFCGSYGAFTKVLGKTLEHEPNVRKACLALNEWGLISIRTHETTDGKRRVDRISINPYWIERLTLNDVVTE